MVPIFWFWFWQFVPYDMPAECFCSSCCNFQCTLGWENLNKWKNDDFLAITAFSVSVTRKFHSSLFCAVDCAASFVENTAVMRNHYKTTTLWDFLMDSSMRKSIDYLGCFWCFWALQNKLKRNLILFIICSWTPKNYIFDWIKIYFSYVSGFAIKINFIKAVHWHVGKLILLLLTCYHKSIHC